jgi:hypothetical protein
MNHTLDVLFGGILVACLGDYLRYSLWGNDYTFSRALLGLEAQHPLFGLAIVYTLMTLAGHLTLPALHADPPWRVWVGALVGVAPLAAANRVGVLHPRGHACASSQLRELLGGGGDWWYFAYLSAAAIAGLLNGKINVRQHA